MEDLYFITVLYPLIVNNIHIRKYSGNKKCSFQRKVEFLFYFRSKLKGKKQILDFYFCLSYIWNKYRASFLFIYFFYFMETLQSTLWPIAGLSEALYKLDNPVVL